jgi:arylsulfatase
MVIDIKLDPFERTPESSGFFLWMKEKSWIAPLVQRPINEFTASMKAFPPRQRGTGVGAATVMKHD